MLMQTPFELAIGVAQRFKKARKGKKISIRELSERSGVPNSTIRRFESTGEISLMSFAKIVSAIGEDREISKLFAITSPASIEEIIDGNRREN